VSTTGRTPPKTLDDLAIFGAPPAFDRLLHVGRPSVGDGDRLLERIGDAVERRRLTNDGPLVREFEEHIAELTGVAHCVAVSSGTVGLQLAARALGFTGEVIVPSFTFVATAHAMSWIGLTPVFCDIDRRTHTIDPGAVEALVTERTGGIVGVHLWGAPCDIDALTSLARERELPLLLDAAHAIACSYRGRPVGGFGDAEVFSFHATKIVNAVEGGAITTNDSELAGRLRATRDFGFLDDDSVAELGTNGKMSELSAAAGLTSLESLDEFTAANRRNHDRYERELQDVRGLALRSYDEAERHNHQFVVLEAPAEARDDLITILHAENVLARNYFHPGCHRLDAYRREDGSPAASLPVTEEVSARVIVLPTGPTMSEQEVALVCAILRAAAESPGEIRRRLA
jgi:dTDP-4-amino-4,6-dideoxygalactose transaminase